MIQDLQTAVAQRNNILWNMCDEKILISGVYFALFWSYPTLRHALRKHWFMEKD